MSRVNIVIGIPSQDTVPVKFMLNLIALISYTKANLDKVDDITLALKTGIRTDRNRNVILKETLEKGDVDYILWLDTDMIYPVDIIVRYLMIKGGFDVIGCMYFKRVAPHDPVVYVRSKKEIPGRDKLYNAVDPASFKFNNVYPVDGVGYGGMMVNMKVYDKLGDKKWTHYGKNHHLPFDAPDRLTHDLVFCQAVQKAGFKILVHGSIRAGHLALKTITEDDYRYHRGIKPKESKVIVKKKVVKI